MLSIALTLTVTSAQGQGPFDSSWATLEKYECPAWFRDAKFGIWAHWGPQSVPMEGDWYARNMYVQGSDQYEDHLKKYGHPSTHGWKDVIPLWKAEKWDPDHLMSLYKAAGAKYFVSMGVHHDNFDLWNSKYHSWNATKVGPHRDVVGEWQKAAKKNGMKFGVSEHLGASFTWFQTSRGSDKTGPMAGVPYDGNDPKNEELYHQKANPGDTGWYSNDPRWHAEWSQRITDLIDTYKPDLLYSDGGFPFGVVGRGVVAHFYNQNIKQHGSLQAVYTAKDASGEFKEDACVRDMERGILGKIEPHPWQTDTSIGDWFYNKHWKYRDASWLIKLLVDIVSKNGNLLINVVQRPDGAIDPEAEQLLKDVGAWMKANGEAIYGTRPWLVAGEGPTRPRGGMFKEDFDFDGRDIRFTTKGDTLYASFLGWPEGGQSTIKCLSAFPSSTGVVKSVQLLGTKAKVDWKQQADGLHVQLPKAGSLAFVLKIQCQNIGGFRPDLVPPPPRPVVTPDTQGAIHLLAVAAQMNGDLVTTEERDGIANIGYWDRPAETVSWIVEGREGDYQGSIELAAPHESELILQAAGVSIRIPVPNTGGYDKYRKLDLPTLHLNAGKTEIFLKPASAGTWKPVNVRGIILRPGVRPG